MTMCRENAHLIFPKHARSEREMLNCQQIRQVMCTVYIPSLNHILFTLARHSVWTSVTISIRLAAGRQAPETQVITLGYWLRNFWYGSHDNDRAHGYISRKVGKGRLEAWRREGLMIHICGFCLAWELLQGTAWVAQIKRTTSCLCQWLKGNYQLTRTLDS